MQQPNKPLGFEKNHKSKEKNQIPEAMETGEEEEASTEEISPEEIDSGRHGAGAGGERPRGRRFEEECVRVGNDPPHRTPRKL